ncbi:histidine phosphatase family protein [Sutcliffiella rhizosphaerae]|uniref:histidine phosphatase family protein n=1 Tax=Sutcliffiella rhizosphaerae TaxID=2880967 RepID=UPI001E4C14B6|nr:histidine phosphatase family protein [Sutcliffiella rhizosphaerae]
MNENGKEQARILRKELHNISFDFVFSSPQKRAVETAEIITGKQAILDDRLDVYNLGEADRLHIRDVKMVGPLPDPSVYKGVEKPEEFVKRVFNFMSDIENKYGKQEKNILICGHRCTTACIGAYSKRVPVDENIFRFSSKTGEYKRFTF